MAKSNNISPLRTTLEKEGFCHLPGALPKAKIQQLRHDAKMAFVTQMEAAGVVPESIEDETLFSKAMFRFFEQDPNRFIGAAKLCQHLISLHQLSLSDEVLAILKEGAGLNFPTISTRPTMFFNSKHLAKSEGIWKTPPHQDWRSIQGSLNSLVVWIPLLNLDKALGTLEVVPKSHHDGLLESTEDDFYRTVGREKYPDSTFRSIEVEAGDCLIFSTFLVHRSGNNTTDRIRWSCHFRYNDMKERTFVDRAFPNPYTYKPQQELITPNFPTPGQLMGQFDQENKEIL
jgi:hypothetical protein